VANLVILAPEATLDLDAHALLEVVTRSVTWRSARLVWHTLLALDSKLTWQDCLSLYLQGAGAPAAGQQGRDGKEKLDANLRMFCQQVVDTTLTRR
jgi:hypothetical protein